MLRTTFTLLSMVLFSGLARADESGRWRVPASSPHLDGSGVTFPAPGDGATGGPVPDTFDPLEADRPDFTESPSVMGWKRLQFEGGWTYLHDEAGTVRSDLHGMPELLLRYGLTKNLELRCEWAGYGSWRVTDEESGEEAFYDGVSDMRVGCKLQITRQDGLRPESALITSVALPVGSPLWTSGRVDNVVNYNYGWDMTDRFSLAGSTGAWWTKFEHDHFTIVHQSIVMGAGLTERLGSYVEWFGLYYEGTDDDRPSHYLDGGFTYLVTEDFQLDWRIGIGLNELSDDLFTGVGFAVRR